MRIAVEDVAMVNWDAVTDTLKSDAAARISTIVTAAKEALTDLKPGEKKTIPIKLGSVTVARPNGTK